jgi:protein TonB
MLQQQIAQLGTEIKLSQQSAEQTKIKFVDSVSAHKYIAAQYMKDWEDKVERTGNLNYPEVAAKKNFSGTLTMDVGIKADGSIYSIRINQSSGNPALDEAAIRIVRMSAPFAPLPTDLQKELDVLVITRVWKFSDESGMTSR